MLCVNSHSAVLNRARFSFICYHFQNQSHALEVCVINLMAITRISTSPEGDQIQIFPLLVWRVCKPGSTTLHRPRPGHLIDLCRMWCFPQKSSRRFHPDKNIVLHFKSKSDRDRYFFMDSKVRSISRSISRISLYLFTTLFSMIWSRCFLMSHAFLFDLL